MMPLIFVGPENDLFELLSIHGRQPEPPSELSPLEAAWIVRGYLDDAQLHALSERWPSVDALAEELARGSMSVLKLRRIARDRPPLDPTAFADSPLLSDLAGDEPPPAQPEAQTWFELRLVDEMGEPIPGIAVSLTVDGTPRELATDGDGVARVDDATMSFSTAKILDIASLRDALRPRWETIREGDWLEKTEHHSYIDCRDPLPSISLTSKTPHTVVVQPRVVCARLLGMFFDTNKAFLLPPALVHIRSIKKLYDERPTADILIVGHTDTTGEPSYNDPLSVERAEAVQAFLRDDVGGWLAWYEPSKPAQKRWGSREDNLMLIAVLAASAEPLTDTPARHFQATRGLKVDGIIGPKTREKLIEEYMAFDGTTLPPGIEPVVHGCGENFPIDDAGELDDDASDDSDEAGDRRVELFFFDGELGVLPAPPAKTSPPGSAQYPEWRRRARETHDFLSGAHRLAAVRVCDDDRHPIPNAPCRFVGTGLTATADDEGFIALDEGIAGESCVIEWTRPGQETVEPWPFSRRVFVHFPAGELGSRRKLHNVGYPITDELRACVLAFQVDFDFEATGELGDIVDALDAWHDGGQHPDPNAPPPPPSPDENKEKGKATKKATAAPKPKTVLLVGVAEKGVTLDKAAVSASVVEVKSGAVLPVAKVASANGGLVFRFVDVTPGLHDITVRRRNPNTFGIEAITVRPGFDVKAGQSHSAVDLPLGTPANKAEVQEHASMKYGFDDFGANKQVPWKSVELGKSDLVRVKITPAGTFGQVTFVVEGSCQVSPARATSDDMTLTIEGKAEGKSTVRAMRDGETIGELNVMTYKKKTKRVMVRLVHGKDFDSTDIQPREKIADFLNNRVYNQAVFEWDVVKVQAFRVDFDVSKDGALDARWTPKSATPESPELQAIIAESKNDGFDCNIFLVDKPHDGSSGVMGFNQRYGFVHVDKSPKPESTIAHELGHGAFGLEHIDKVPDLKKDVENIMNGDKSTTKFRLRKVQWDQIHSK